jgi:hypothetical protein
MNQFTDIVIGICFGCVTVGIVAIVAQLLFA